MIFLRVIVKLTSYWYSCMKTIHAQELKSFSNIAIAANSDGNSPLYEQFIHALVERLNELDFSDEYITLVTAHSFLDLPIMANLLAKSQEYSAVLMICFYHKHERDEYLATISNTSVLTHGFAIEENQEHDKVSHDARELADRIYSTISIMEQVS